VRQKARFCRAFDAHTMNRRQSSPAAFPSLPLDFVLPDDTPSLRLDAALGLALPELGLRGRRRLWSWCRICVNGTGRHPGYMLRGGDAVRVVKKEGDAVNGCAAPFLLALNQDFAVLCKPEGLHSAHIAGGAEPSLESLLPALWPGLWKQWFENIPPPGRDFPANPCRGIAAGRTCFAVARQSQAQKATASDPTGCPEVPSLLTRLDRGTSGIVLAALHPDAGERFRREERCGMVRKSYFALVRGVLAEPLRLRFRLMTDNRERTLVRDEEEEDATRHTLVEPLGLVPSPAPFGSEAVSLVRVRIQRGARHQIRAHLAHAGFPLLGECLYAPPLPGVVRLYLHHAALRLPGFVATCRPSWGFEDFYFGKMVLGRNKK
jgi:23S rRNA pseudouridine1911/1915/1917 synthase